MFHTSHIEISESSLRNNINFIKRKINNGATLSAVVKGNAYGHGIEEFVPLAEKMGIRHFSVFSAQEARRIRNITRHSEVMVMGMIADEELAWAVENDVQVYTFDKERLQYLLEAAKSKGKMARVHIELETGMNRTGLEECHLDDVFTLLQKNKEHYQLEGLCTHLAGAESIANHIRIMDQVERYNQLCHLFEEKGMKPRKKHISCSAATIAYPELHYDMVRVGIMLYGFWPSQEILIRAVSNGQINSRRDPLKRVISWKSRVMSLKHVELGEWVGYGTNFQAGKNMKVATVPVGYAYGYSRAFSNQGSVLIHGKRADVLGIVNMNIIIVDISNIKHVKRGDEVVFIGKQNKSEIKVASFEQTINQLNYELLSRLPEDIPRTVIE